MADTQTLTYLIKFLADTRGVAVTKAETDKLSASFNKLGIDASKISSILNTQVVSSLDSAGNVIKKVNVTFKDASGRIGQATLDMNNFGNISKLTSTGMLPLIENMQRLASRAALTIPLWLALRAVFTSTLGTITDSATSFIKLDEALKNAENEIKGTKNIAEFMERLKDSARGLATETGLGPEKIVESFRQFATAGIDAETSLAGMNTAVKGSIATMGDSIEVSKLLADVYNQMGDKITEVTGPQEKFNFIMSTIATLMPTNTFSIKEFGDALTNFIGTAKAANLTLDQTFTLVATSATAMQRGARGGSQLASAFSQLSVKSKEIQQFLGKPTTGLSQFDIFFQTLQKAASIAKSSGQLPTDIQDIFGLKGGKDVKAEAASLGHFVDELERLGKLSPSDRTAQLLDRYGTATEKISLQLNRLKQVREELGKVFIEGVSGGDSFVNTLKNINAELLEAKPLLELLGRLTRFTIVNPIKAVGLTGEASVAGVKVLQNNVVSGQANFQRGRLMGELLKLGIPLEQLIFMSVESMSALAASISATRRTPIVQRPGGAVVRGLENKFPTTTEEERTINQTILDIRQDLLKTQGALNSEILKDVEASKKKLGLVETELEKTVAKLKIEQETTKEKRLQGRLGSDSLKLFDIAQTQGIEIAKQIGDVLSGATDLDTFIRRGGPAADTFKAQFGDLFKQKQAEAFFRGDITQGFQELQGGNRISTQENLTGQLDSSARIQQLQALDTLRFLKESNATTNKPQVTQTISVNNTFNVSSQTPDETVEAVAKSMEQPGGRIRKALALALGGIDNQTV